jgi:hypothetical protein
MMWHMNKSIVALLAAVACALCLGSKASAQTERFAVFSVQNDTGNLTITYEIKLGDGQWQTYTVAPGQSRTFWHEFKNQNDRTFPTTTIRFNSAVGNNPKFMIEYNLDRYAAPDRLYKYAKQYSFKKNDDNYYDLSSIN